MSCGVETMISTRQRRLLRHRQLRVAGTGRQIDDQDVEFAPGNLAQHLLQRAHDHRAAPDHRRVFRHKKAHRHDLEPVILHRLKHLAVAGAGPARNPQHARHRRAVDVGVEHADPQPVPPQGQSKVGGDRGLADAALARCDCDDRLDAGDSAALRPMLRPGWSRCRRLRRAPAARRRPARSAPPIPRVRRAMPRPLFRLPCARVRAAARARAQPRSKRRRCRPG